MADPTRQKAVVTPQTHSGLRWRPPRTYAGTFGDGLVPLGLSELEKAAPFFPVRLAWAGPSLGPVAMLARPGQETSPFLASNGALRAGYVPVVMRCHPFSVIDADGKAVLCSDPSTGCIDRTRGPFEFFNEDGTLASQARIVATSLAAWAKDRLAAIQACQLLRDMGMITIDPATGLAMADATVLSDIDDERAGRLLREGALSVVFSQAISNTNLAKLETKSDSVVGPKASKPADAEDLLASLTTALGQDDIFHDLL